tara:strand:+ start:166 stop:414 length:249 start_codon:yes stop_codon:yes gene_type:complete
MKNYKVTNLKTEVVEYLNYDEILNRKLINREFDLKYSFEYISNTPIIDKLNKVAYSLLDIIVLFAMSLGLGVIGLEVLTNLI